MQCTIDQAWVTLSNKCISHDSMQIQTIRGGPTVLSPLLALDGVSFPFASFASPRGCPNRDPSPASDSLGRAPWLSLPLNERCSVLDSVQLAACSMRLRSCVLASCVLALRQDAAELTKKRGNMYRFVWIFFFVHASAKCLCS